MSRERLMTVLLEPHVSEKATRAADQANQVVFKVHPAANKIEIKEAVEKMFNVKVGNVRTASMRGKQKRVGRYIGYTKDWKKAYVTLSEGEISFVDEL